jgi:hypothetical protein
MIEEMGSFDKHKEGTRLGEGWLSVKGRADREYQQVVQEHARDGWRLVQVFAPSLGAYGASKYFEVILEQETGGLTANQQMLGTASPHEIRSHERSEQRLAILNTCKSNDKP